MAKSKIKKKNRENKAQDKQAVKAAEKKFSGEKYSVEDYKNRIYAFLLRSGKKPLAPKELAAKCRSDKGNRLNYGAALDELISEGVICERKRGYVLCEIVGFFRAEVTRLKKTFGFIKRSETEEEIFVPGKFLCGAMPGDIVLANYIESRSEDAEGEVLSVLVPSDSKLTGVITEEEGQLLFLPDTMSKTSIRIDGSDVDYEPGDKVLAELIRMGSRHRDHKVRIILRFGSSESADCCAQSVLALNGIEKDFPAEVKNEAKRIAAAGVWRDDYRDRLDLRSLPIFTIDGADTKDIDDAVSLEKTSGGYRLGVHIADVSHYVRGNSPLDREAMDRGTSIYYADKVIPMLPEELSNGICSLNPGEDRLAFSAIMKVSPQGEILDFMFEKSVICSKVKGVYTEVNSIIDGTASDELMKKYEGLTDEIMLMDKFADILISARRKRGSPEIETSESKLIIDDSRKCVDVVPRKRGKAEMMIEEFMLLANEAAAKLASRNEIPFVYRAHEAPAPEKVESLKDSMTRLHVEVPHFTEIKPTHLAQILENASDKDSYPVVNMMVLRSMAKAKYQTEPIGHFGLALDDYAHFTSPIRRYPDLAIHRILTDLIDGMDKERIEKRYRAFATKASEHSTAMEIRAMNVERDCEDCYKAEYMQAHIGDEFEGIISGVTDFGFYVELPNTVEGLVHINTLPEGLYSYDGYFSINDEYSDKSFTAGDKVRVICAKADVNSGNIDFELA